MKIRRDLLQHVFDTLEALWDCSCPDMPEGEECDHCVTLAELREVLNQDA